MFKTFSLCALLAVASAATTCVEDMQTVCGSAATGTLMVEGTDQCLTKTVGGETVANYVETCEKLT